jgi:hypothetical protein
MIRRKIPTTLEKTWLQCRYNDRESLGDEEPASICLSYGTMRRKGKKTGYPLSNHGSFKHV